MSPWANKQRRSETLFTRLEQREEASEREKYRWERETLLLVFQESML